MFQTSFGLSSDVNWKVEINIKKKKKSTDANTWQHSVVM